LRLSIETPEVNPHIPLLYTTPSAVRTAAYL
jgi:hypothetical protein